MDNQNSLLQGQLDYNLGWFFLAKNTNLILQYLKTGPLGFNATVLMLDFQHWINQVAIANPTDLEIDFSWTTVSLDLQKLFGTDFDLSLSIWWVSWIHEEQCMFQWFTIVQILHLLLSTNWWIWKNMNTTTGLGSDASLMEISCLSLVNIVCGIQQWGAEYLAGSQDVFYFNAAAEDLTLFLLLQLQGTAYHAYVTPAFIWKIFLGDLDICNKNQK